MVNSSNLASKSPELLRRVIAACVGTIYATFLLETYVELSKLWSYIGFWYRPPEPTVTWASIASVTLLSILLPTRNWTITDFCKWILHFLLFVPALIIPPQQGNLPAEYLFALQIAIWASAAILVVFLQDGKPFKEISVSRRALWQGVSAVWISSNLAIIFVFYGSMSLVGIEQVYEQRDAAATSLGGGMIVYVMGMMSGAVNPFLLVIGIKTKKLVLIGCALIGQLIIYSTLAGKVVLGSTLLIVAVYFIFSNGKVIYNRVYSGILVLACAGPWVTVSRATSGDLISILSDMIYFRILTMPGVLVGAYSEFFLRYPVTYLSHSLIGRPFSEYPYGEQSIGQVIGLYVTPTLGRVNNYNANFIAADGIAGFGHLGIPLIFFVVGIWLWFVSKLIGQQQRAVSCAMLAPFIVSLADASLFTAMLTGGGGAAAVLLYLHRSTEGGGRSHLVD